MPVKPITKRRLKLGALVAACAISKVNALTGIGGSCVSDADCETSNCESASGACFIAGFNQPKVPKPCSDGSDCAYRSFCGSDSYGTENQCYMTGAFCSMSESYDDPSCSYYTGCAITSPGICMPADTGAPPTLEGDPVDPDTGSGTAPDSGASMRARHIARAIAQRKAKKTKALCPMGYEACLMPSGGFECVDLLEELSHCGQCGNDCEQQGKPGQSSSCVAGRCILGPDPDLISHARREI